MDPDETTKQHVDASAAGSRQIDDARSQIRAGAESRRAIDRGARRAIGRSGRARTRPARAAACAKWNFAPSVATRRPWKNTRSGSRTISDWSSSCTSNISYPLDWESSPSKSCWAAAASGWSIWDGTPGFHGPWRSRSFAAIPTDRAPRSGDLLREARAAAQLRHPGVVAVYAVQPDADGDEFLVLEYVDGKSLKDLLRSERMTPLEAANLMLAVAGALCSTPTKTDWSTAI